MADHTSSGYRVSYDIRPSKQAERYIIVEIMRSLEKLGVPIGSYHYVGMGSYFFHDYRLFHRELRITTMTSIEGDPTLINRCEFNKPYSAIALFEGMSYEFLPSLARDERYLVWLDYDFSLNAIVAEDLITCASRLAVGSILLLTVDTSLPTELEAAEPHEIFEFYQDELPGSLTRGMEPSDFASSNRDRTIRSLIWKSLAEGMRGRSDVSFQNLISIYYSDGNKMHSAGGIIGSEALTVRLREGGLLENSHVRTQMSEEPLDIPRIVLTHKERLELEKICLGPGVYNPLMGVPLDLVEAYKRYYLFLPRFAEVL